MRRGTEPRERVPPGEPPDILVEPPDLVVEVRSPTDAWTKAFGKVLEYLEAGVRLLRPGGVIAFDNALRSGRVADPAYRDPSYTALREIGAMVRDDETLIPLMLPLGAGLLLALRS